MQILAGGRRWPSTVPGYWVAIKILASLPSHKKQGKEGPQYACKIFLKEMIFK